MTANKQKLCGDESAESEFQSDSEQIILTCTNSPNFCFFVYLCQACCVINVSAGKLQDTGEKSFKDYFKVFSG
jgi:hypothetical protein